MVKTLAKTAYLNTRLDPKLKAEAEGVFKNIGVSTSEAISIFLHQVVAHRGFPFPVREPNEETIAAIREDLSDKPTYKDADAMMREILDESD